MMSIKHTWATGGLLVLVVAASPVTSAPLKLDTNCQLDVPNLGARFQGHSADAVVASLKKDALAKDQFETQGQYEDRLASTLEGKPLAIQTGALCVTFNRAVDTEYDAESQTLWVNTFIIVPQTWVVGGNVRRDYQVYVSQRNVAETSYIGSNAYGTEMEVFKRTRDATYVSFDRDQTLAGAQLVGAEFRNGIQLAFPVPLLPDRARAAHKNTDVAIKYALEAPYIGTATKSELPKIDSPFDRKEKQVLVIGRPTQLAIFNSETGEVLKFFDLTGSGPSSPNNADFPMN